MKMNAGVRKLNEHWRTKYKEIQFKKNKLDLNNREMKNHRRSSIVLWPKRDPLRPAKNKYPSVYMAIGNAELVHECSLEFLRNTKN